MLTNKCFVKFVAGQKRLGFASSWVFFEREVNFCFAESVDGCVVQPKDTAMALPRRPRAFQNLVVSTSSDILPSSEVMAINLPAPRGRACSHRTSRLSSRSFRGVRLQTRVVVVCTAGFGCHCLYQLFGVAALAHRGLPPLSGVCAGSATGFPRTACLRAVGVTAPPCPDQRQAVLGARDSSQMLGGLG